MKLTQLKLERRKGTELLQDVELRSGAAQQEEQNASKLPINNTFLSRIQESALVFTAGHGSQPAPETSTSKIRLFPLQHQGAEVQTS